MLHLMKFKMFPLLSAIIMKKLISTFEDTVILLCNINCSQTFQLIR